MILTQSTVLVKDGIRYRVLGFNENNIIVIQLDTNKRIIFSLGTQDEILNLIAQKKIECIEELYSNLLLPEMSDAIKASYEKNKRIIAEINANYRENCYLGLANLKNKKCLKEIRENYNISKSSLERLILRYLQSGCTNYSLLDKRGGGLSKKPKAYNYTKGKRPGRQTDVTSEVVLTSYERGLFDSIISHRFSSRFGSFKGSFNTIIKEAYNVELDENGLYSYDELRHLPTLKQFYNYLKGKITKKELYCVVNSKTEHRNNHRPLLGDTTVNALGIGDSTQVDILDADLFLKGRVVNGVIGRPHIYMLRDIATRVILAYAVTLKNNSIYGLNMLLVNLSANKVALASKYDINIASWQWPSNIIPGSIYCDNGADFKSLKIEEIYKRLRIERNLEPPALGSMKGTVESGFASFNDFYKESLEKIGVISRRYDSAHKENAKIQLDCLNEIVIRYIIYHNCHSISCYPLTKNMIENGVLPRPVDLWRYFEKLYPYRIISNNTEYLFDCMFEDTASITRKGIMFQGFSYLPDVRDKDFTLDMDNHITSKKITIRYSYLDDSFILYFRKNHCYVAHLNDGKTAEKSLIGLDFGVLEEYNNTKRKQNRIGEVINMVLKADSVKALEKIQEALKNEPTADTKNIRENRQKEQALYKEESSPFTNFDEFGNPILQKNDMDTIKNEDKEKKNSTAEENSEKLESIGWEDAIEDFLF